MRQYVVAVPNFNFAIRPLGVSPILGMPAFSTGYQQVFRYVLNIPGTPRLIHRRKDTFFPFNRAIDHYAMVFITGQDGWARPDDWVFEIRAGSNHIHAPFRFKDFDKGDGPVLHHLDVKFDSKEKVISRLEAFYRNPTKYDPIAFNCEDYGRWVMTGIPACTQRERVIEGGKIALDIMGKMVIEAAEQDRKRQEALAEAKRQRVAALEAQAAQAAIATMPPPEIPAPVTRQPMTAPEAIAYLAVASARAKKPVPKKRKRTRAQGKKSR